MCFFIRFFEDEQGGVVDELGESGEFSHEPEDVFGGGFGGHVGGFSGGPDDTFSAERFALEINGVCQAVGVHDEHIAILQSDFLLLVGAVGIEAEDSASFGEIDNPLFS